MKKLIFFTFFFISLCINLNGQNIGIGTSNPTEPLEVAGTIYSSNGGIKFPDATMQMTAATNESVASAAQTRLIGYLKYDQIDGEINTIVTFPVGGNVMFNNVFPVYEMEFNEALGKISIVTDISSGSPALMEAYFTGATSEAAIFLLRENTPHPHAYYSLQTNASVITSSRNELRPVGGGKFAHLQRIEYTVDQLTFKSHDDPTKEFCWDPVAQSPCGSGG